MNNNIVFFLRFCLVSMLLVLVSCASAPEEPAEEVKTKQESDELPESGMAAIDESEGSIYNRAWTMSLFDDNRARKIGDTIIVELAEATNASKRSSTSTSKSQDVDIPGPTIFGRPVTHNGVPILETDIESDHGFDGEGSSSQSNSLTGNITVLVKDVLPNGNMIVEGEKWLTINQGKEYVKLTGIVRPSDIETDNTVPSWKVANADISYSGEGALHDANRMGWLGRFFQSIFSPF